MILLVVWSWLAYNFCISIEQVEWWNRWGLGIEYNNRYVNYTRKINIDFKLVRFNSNCYKLFSQSVSYFYHRRNVSLYIFEASSKSFQFREYGVTEFSRSGKRNIRSHLNSQISTMQCSVCRNRGKCNGRYSKYYRRE